MAVDHDPVANSGSVASADEALRNWQANIAALARTQPDLVTRLEVEPPDITWTYGRDGCLTARDEHGRWWSGCSIPRRAAQAMLCKLELRGTTGCFLEPAHGAQIQAALQRLTSQQAIIAAMPALPDLWVALHCFDFSEYILHHRLWFAAGPSWPKKLGSILRDHPGLPEPQQFIRAVTLSESRCGELIPPAQSVITQETQHREALLRDLASKAPARDSLLCIVAPSHFRLWNDAGAVLAETMLLAGRDRCIHFDPDDPASASNLALATAASRCRAVVVTNLTRPDFRNLLHPSIPLVTWLTVPCIPPFSAVGAHDALLLADSSWLRMAVDRSWPESRLSLAAWPTSAPFDAHSASPSLAIIADTLDISPDRRSFDLSSHRLLWELIAHELDEDPFLLPADINSYLDSRIRQLGIAPESVDRVRFIEELIQPAYEQSLARLLISAGISVRIYGRGWTTLLEFAPHATGPVESRAQLLVAARESAALVHVWPIPGAHPIDALGRPVLRRDTSDRRAWLATAHKMLASRPARAAQTQPLDGHRVVKLTDQL